MHEVGNEAASPHKEDHEWQISPMQCLFPFDGVRMSLFSEAVLFFDGVLAIRMRVRAGRWDTRLLLHIGKTMIGRSARRTACSHSMVFRSLFFTRWYCSSAAFWRSLALALR